MAKSLIIVESPSKAKTIQKYVGDLFEVAASVGHIKDLPKNEMGVDLDNDFAPHYVTIRGKKQVLQQIKKASKQAERVFLAPDPDREGEAIAWHIAEEIRGCNTNLHRVMFNEITKSAVQQALANPLELNLAKYESQQARRILDRLVGYQISPLLWEKVRRGLSAGRVQSVAVRLIVDREKEIEAFVADEYWTITAHLPHDPPPALQARLLQRDGKKWVPTNADEAHQAQSVLERASYRVKSVEKRSRKRNPQAPFITSTLQQDGSRRLGFTAKRTMMVAQQLYEGVELGAEGAVGLITYMRTDSTRLSNEAVAACRVFVEERFGAAYIPTKPHQYKSKKSAQDAHEAIRPTDVQRTPESVKGFLSAEQFKLYQLIWQRFVACQMSPALFDQTTIDIDADRYTFRSTGSVQVFAGFLSVYAQASDEESDEAVLPPVTEGEALELEKLDVEQKFTQPPPRFTEAALVKELEDKGIGRPSTYAAIISTILDKKYVEKSENKFQPTELGRVVTELLIENFPHILDARFTAQMESNLDQIESGKARWLDVLHEFYADFRGQLETAREQMRNVKREETPTEIDCPRCGHKLVIKFGRNGSFLACSTYPDCNFTSEFERNENGDVRIREDDKLDRECPKCHSALVVKSGRFGRFVACSSYPECSHTEPLTIGVDCPRDGCSGRLMEKRTRKGRIFYACTTFPKCDFASWNRPIAEECPVCGSKILEEIKKRGSEGVQCPKCKWQKPRA
ncbi:MAG: type I DNA topoisomerase [Myxococcales bacterium]|nr:type I DNA topoisomerase [Myxococcales bacterium]